MARKNPNARNKSGLAHNKALRSGASELQFT